jgi:glyoxylase-like metal-dependent hydrolase (beta-lactamase superfamily II)
LPEIHRLALPTPFPVGPVNSYVLKPSAPGRGPLTLVDPGPNYPPARAALEEGLKRLGIGLGDFEAIFLTHPHLDHYGLTSEIVAVSGAKVVAHVDAVSRLTGRIGGAGSGEMAVLEQVLTRAGGPEGFGATLSRQWAAAEALGAPSRVDRPLSGGDTVEGGGVTWRAIPTPGHSPGAICYYDEEGLRLLSGDHLLPHITSNAIMELRETGGPDQAPTIGQPLRRAPSLQIYLESLSRVESLELREILPGHGPPFSGHRELIADRRRHYEARKSVIAALLGRTGPSTAFRVALTLFPEQGEPTGQFLALSEVLGHLDLLEAEGRVRRIQEQDVDLYCLAEEVVGSRR